MAGRIKAEDITAVKERTSIEDVVRDHVTLRPAGVGSLKGLCPFHDEKSPSFTVRPAVGSYHCFGCGEGGDVISFVQKVEHLTFTESVERLAAKLGLELRYEEGGGPREGGVSLGKRSRLIEAHRVAQEFYAAILQDTSDPEARPGRDFLRERGFDGTAAKRFGVGFAPRSGEALTRHLRERGFTEDEMVTGGLSGRGSRGLYDRFRGRLVWPIRDTTGDTVGFGARRVLDDDRIAAKYLNTSETPIYKKSQVLYGLDSAKKAIATERQAVVVEGYTDVMAAHLSGVEGAVATCGTAFGIDHIKILRRIMRDEADLAPARVVFTFDGDAAGQKAAMRAFAEDQRWAAQSFVAVAPDGMDPCDLRLAKGDTAVQGPRRRRRADVRVRRAHDDPPLRPRDRRGAGPGDEGRRPDHRLDPRHEPAPRVHPHRLRLARASRSSRWRPRCARPARCAPTTPPTTAAGPRAPTTSPSPASARPRRRCPSPTCATRSSSPSASCSRRSSSTPCSSTTPRSTRSVPEAFSAPAHRAVLDGIRIAAPTSRRGSTAAWVAAVAEHAPLAVRGLVSELSVAPLPTRYDSSTGLPPQRYLDSLVTGVRDAHLGRLIADAMASVRRVQNDPDADPADLRERTMVLHRLEIERVRLREGVSS